MASSDFSLSSGNPGGVAIGEPRTLGPNSQVHRPLVPGPNLIGNGQLAAVEFIQGETINRHLLEKSHPLSVIQEVRGNQATEFSQLTQGVDGKVGGNSQDPGSDRHAGTGMTFSNQFHQGQTSSSSSQQGATRFGIFEERLQAFTPGPPHKIQMEVQLSDATRLQVEVAVQQRQVYAGLLVDQPAFRALALQNQPQLEAQLNQVGLELREFGAEIEDQAKNSREALGDQGQERGRSTTTENEVEGIRSQEKRIKVEQESTQGFHYVA
jgi:hypothetical protein